MRNLFRTTISSIAYLRDLFPENCFRDHNVNGILTARQMLRSGANERVGINIKQLIPKTRETTQVIEWLENGVFHALERKYVWILCTLIRPLLNDCVAGFGHIRDLSRGVRFNHDRVLSL